MKLRTTFLSIVAAGVLSAATAEAVSLDVQPTSPGPFMIGDIVEFSVTLSSDFPSATGFELITSYDSDALQFLSAAILAPIFQLGVPTPPAMPMGLETLGAATGGVLPPSTIDADQTVATFSFQALAAGPTQIIMDTEFANPNPNDPLNPIVVFDGQGTGSVVIEGHTGVVPLPATGLLLLTALAGLPFLRARAARRV